MFKASDVLAMSNVPTAGGSNIVYNPESFSNAVVVTGLTILSNAQVTGAALFGGVVSLSNAVFAASTLDVIGAATVGANAAGASTLSVGRGLGAAQLNLSDVPGARQQLSTAGGSLKVFNDAATPGALGATPLLTLSNASVGVNTGAPLAGYALTVEGATSLSGALVASNALSVAGLTTLSNAAQWGAASFCNGALGVGSALNVTGATTVAGAFAHTGTASFCNGALGVGSALSVAGAFAQSGAASFSNGAVGVGSALNVAGATSLSNSVAVYGTLSASNPVFLASNLTVMGTLTAQNAQFLYSNVTIYQSETIHSNLVVENTAWTSNLSVGSNAAFALGASFSNAAVGVGGALNVAGAAALAGPLAVFGTLSASNPVFLASNLTVLGTITALSAEFLYSNLTVLSTTTSNMSVSSNASFMLGASFSNGSVGVACPLNVAGATTAGAFAQSGAASFCNGALGVGSALNVGGAATFAGAAAFVSGIALTGDLMPTGSHTQNIGSSNNRFGTAWIDTLHISSNTLYLGATPVLGTQGTTVTITADVDQSINISTKGVGATQLSSASEVDITTSGINANVKINANGAGGQVLLGSDTAVVLTAPNTSVGGALTVSSNVTVNGNLTVNGTTATMNCGTLQVMDNIVLLNMGQTGNGVSQGTAGFRVARGNLADFNVIFNESNACLNAGPIGSELPIATQQFVLTALALASNADAQYASNAAVYASNASMSPVVPAQAAFASNLALTWQASAGKANVIGVLSASNATYLASNLTVLGATSLSNSVAVYGTLSASNPVFLASNLTVMGTLTTQNIDYLYSNVTIFQSETIQSNLVVQNTTWMSNASVGSNAAFLLGATFSNAAVGVGGALNVAGALTASNTVNLGGALNVAGQVTLVNTALNNKQLVLYDNVPAEAAATASNFLGFGVNTSTLRYQVAVGNWHKWYSGATNTLVLDGSGNLTATANVTAYSDARLKDDVVRIGDALVKIGQLGGYTFVRNDLPGEKGVRSTGVIAQEVQKVLPEAVRANDDGLLSVSYGNMVGLLIEGIKELAARVDAQDAAIAALQKK